MREYMIDQRLYQYSMQNGTDKDLVQIFDHSLTVWFMILSSFKIDIINCDWNI